MTLFKKAVTAKRNLKALIFGPPGSGKTWFGLASKSALEGKRVVYIGNEQGAAFYADIPELAGFDLLETRDLEKVEQAVGELERGNHDYGVLVLDTITDLHKQRQRRFANKDGDIQIRSWGKIKSQHDDLVRRIINLSMHVIVIAQEKPLYDKSKGQLVQTGVAIDSDKKDDYMFDLVGHMTLEKNGRYLYIVKDRTRKSKTGSKVKNPEFQMWGGVTVKESAQIEEGATPVTVERELKNSKGKTARAQVLQEHKALLDDIPIEVAAPLRNIEAKVTELEEQLKSECGILRSTHGPGFFRRVLDSLSISDAHLIDADELEEAGAWGGEYLRRVQAMSVVDLERSISDIKVAIQEVMAAKASMPEAPETADAF